MSLSVHPLPGPLGAEIRGLDPRDLGETDRPTLRRAFFEYGVLVVRGLDVSPAEHVALTRALGEPAIHPIPTLRLKGHPEVIVLGAEAATAIGADDPTADEVVGQIAWHSDLTYTATPSRGALLLARAVPPELGETGFIDTAAVYDVLPPQLRDRAEGLRAVHSLGPIREQLRDATQMSETEKGVTPTFESVIHPLVHVHPESRRKVLNVSPVFAKTIEGLDATEGEALLEELKAFASQERFAYDHHWEVGDLVVWDNWRTMHTARGHKRRHHRCMHRTTLANAISADELAA